jgi:hypothetical protein
MIKLKRGYDDWVKIDHVINHNDTISPNWYLMVVGYMGEVKIIVRSFSESDALDEYADSKIGKRLSKVKKDALDDYLQDGRQFYKESIQKLAKSIQESYQKIEDWRYSDHDAKSDLKKLKQQIESIELTFSHKNYEWDENGPYTGVDYLGNESEMFDLSDMVIFERVNPKNINWFAKED